MTCSVSAQTFFSSSEMSKEYWKGCRKAVKVQTYTLMAEENVPFRELYDELFEPKDDGRSKDLLGDYYSYELAPRRPYALMKRTGSETTIRTETDYIRSAKKEAAFRKDLRRVEKQLGLDKMGRFYQIKAIHDYIINHTEYEKCNSAYSAFYYRASQCLGYSLLFYLMCRDQGIPCRLVVSNDHCWNIVELKGKWYHVDVTWDDTLGSNKYLLFGKKTLKTHEKKTKLLKKYKTESWEKKYPVPEKDYSRILRLL